MSCGNIFTWLIDSSSKWNHVRCTSVHVYSSLESSEKNKSPKSETDITLHISHGCLHDSKTQQRCTSMMLCDHNRQTSSTSSVCSTFWPVQRFVFCCLFVFFLKQLNTHIYSAVTLAAAGCSLIERSVVKSQASAALRSVLGPDAKLLSKNVQLLSIVLLMRACLNGREKHRKSLFSSLAAAS